MITKDKENKTISISHIKESIYFILSKILSVLTFNIERQDLQWIMSVSIIDSVPFVVPDEVSMTTDFTFISIEPMM